MKSNTTIFMLKKLSRLNAAILFTEHYKLKFFNPQGRIAKLNEHKKSYKKNFKKP